MTEQADVTGQEGWATGVWEMLAEGGFWGIPRSGLGFVKRDGKLFAHRTEWDETAPCTAEELREMQDWDLDGVTRLFKSIGIEVVGDE